MTSGISTKQLSCRARSNPLSPHTLLWGNEVVIGTLQEKKSKMNKVGQNIWRIKRLPHTGFLLTYSPFGIDLQQQMLATCLLLARSNSLSLAQKVVLAGREAWARQEHVMSHLWVLAVFAWKSWNTVQSYSDSAGAIQQGKEEILTSKGTCMSSRSGSFRYSDMKAVMDRSFSQGSKLFSACVKTSVPVLKGWTGIL